ncbi:hypothetical protein GCM10009736_75120 [Actinomadura bangladeshensis]
MLSSGLCGFLVGTCFGPACDGRPRPLSPGSTRSTRSLPGSAPPRARPTTRTSTPSDGPTHSGAVPPRDPDRSGERESGASPPGSSFRQGDHAPVAAERVRTATAPFNPSRAVPQVTPSMLNGSVPVRGTPAAGRPLAHAAFSCPESARVCTSLLTGRMSDADETGFSAGRVTP